MPDQPDKTLKQHASKVLRVLKKQYPDAICSLDHRGPLELTIATILSAQCTDERVNVVTTELFKKYRSASDYANAEIEELEQDVHSTGFYKNKAKNIKACCRLIGEKHDGEVPQDLDALVQLPGIGRKTANCVLGNAFGITSGIVVDTHVGRLSRRLGLTAQKNAEKVEQEMMPLVPKKEWIHVSHRLIQHGRKVCRSRKPACDECPLSDICPRIGVETA